MLRIVLIFEFKCNKCRTYGAQYSETSSFEYDLICLIIGWKNFCKC